MRMFQNNFTWEKDSFYKVENFGGFFFLVFKFIIFPFPGTAVSYCCRVSLETKTQVSDIFLFPQSNNCSAVEIKTIIQQFLPFHTFLCDNILNAYCNFCLKPTKYSLEKICFSYCMLTCAGSMGLCCTPLKLREMKQGSLSTDQLAVSLLTVP